MHRSQLILLTAFGILLLGVSACDRRVALPIATPTAIVQSAAPVRHAIATISAQPIGQPPTPASPQSTVSLSPTQTAAPTTLASPTAVAQLPTTTPRPRAVRSLTADQIAATAIADSVGEQCVAAPPKPAKGFIGDPVRGKALYQERGCSACHGAQAQGDVGPKLAGTTLPFGAVIHQLRQPRGVMQRYLPADQSDADECDVYIYVKGLKP